MIIYYINLDHRTDRRDQLEQRLAELSLSATRISAATPAELLASDRQACLRSQRTSDPIVEVELCCNLSHKRAYEAFLQTDEQYAVVFEDDALIADDLPEVLAQIQKDGMPCDLLRLETFVDRTQFGTRPTAQFGRYSARTMHSYTWGTAGYVINRKAAERYLATPKLLGITTDRALWRRFPNKTGVKILQLSPAPVVQMDRLTGEWDAHSSIAAQRSAIHSEIVRNEPVTAKIRRFCRDEFTIALPALLHRLLGFSTRGSIPFTGPHPLETTSARSD